MPQVAHDGVGGKAMHAGFFADFREFEQAPRNVRRPQLVFCAVVRRSRKRQTDCASPRRRTAGQAQQGCQLQWARAARHLRTLGSGQGGQVWLLRFLPQ